MTPEDRLPEGGGGDGKRGDGLAASSAVAQTPAPPRFDVPPASRTAHWRPGLMVFHAPGVLDLSWRALSEEARDEVVSRGRPVLLVDPRPTAEGMVRVDDGRAERMAPVGELAEVGEEEVGPLSRIFAHAAASPSPRCAAALGVSTLRPTPLDWLSPAGLRAAGQATFEVAGRALRHIIGRGGATIRRLEAGLGVLVGVVDSPGESAAVSLCGPAERLADAERVIRLVGRGHRSLLARLEEDPGTWAESDAGGD